MAKKKGGLDALFSKVFSDDNVKGAIASLHSDYTPSELHSTPDLTPSFQTDVDQAIVVAAEAPCPTGSPQPDKQASNQSHNLTIRQTGTRQSNQTIEQTPLTPDRQTGKPTISQSLQHTINHSDNQTSDQAISQTIEHNNEQEHGQAIEQAIKQSYGVAVIKPRQKWYPLNENQGRILLFLYENGGGLTNMEIVVSETGIAYGTARACIDVLMREGYVTHKTRHNGHSFRGFEYSMNNHLCSLYVAGINGDTTQQTIRQSLKQYSSQTGSRAVGQSIEPSSSQATTVVSSFKNYLKTTTPDLNDLNDFLQDPELGYWREKGLSGRQLQSWSDEFQMSVDQVIQSLKYCRYELVVLNQEEEKQISNPMNWFYKIMQRSGLYPKPAGYKSLAEIRAEQMEQAAKEAAEARERQAAAETELAFQKMMSDPEGELYKSLLSQANDFAREMGGKALESALKELFIEMR